MIYLLITLAIIIVICFIVIIKQSNKVNALLKEQIPLIEKNYVQENENNQLIQEGLNLQNKIDFLNGQIKSLDSIIIFKQKEIDDKTNTFESVQNAMAEAIRNQKKLVIQEANKEYEKHTAELEEAYQILLDDLMSESDRLLADIGNEQNTLNALKQKQRAYLLEQQHKEEMLKKQDYYRLVISDNDKKDIDLLRNIQNSFSKKEAIDKVIWENYFRPAYDILMPHLFADNKAVCGIYKITCLTNEKAYIGQSVDIRSRFREHAKAAIAANGTNNKLYAEMRSQGLENFLFEVLEIVPRPQLNERELYWIDFYGTKEFGLNVTKGNEK